MKFTESLAGKLATALEAELKGAVFQEAYSSGKDELFITFRHHNFFTLRLTWEARLCFLFFIQEPIAKPTPHYWFFNELKELPIVQIKHHPGNRSFQINFEQGYTLVFKLYDGLSNVLLLHQNQLLYHFRKNIGSDYNFSVNQLIENTEYAELNPKQDKLSIDEANLFSWFNNTNRKFLSQYAFDEEKRVLTQYYKQELKKSKQYLLKSKESLIELEAAVPYEEIGHILMANLHVLEPEQTEVTLLDFYRNQSIRIKLKKELNGQQNAANYYRKAKSRKIEEEQLKLRIRQAETRIAQAEIKLNQLASIESLKELRSLKQGKPVKQKTEASPFRRFEFEGFDIWVGKSAANNDELTFKHSHKNDLWLHARDVSGSHVIIRHRQQQPFPSAVILYAASLAAYYSKAKGSSMVPVVYCERKFVRKPREAYAGEVAHEKGEVVLVKPMSGEKRPAQ